MPATYIHNTVSNTTRDLVGALNLAKALGLSETVIGAITSTGTVAKLRAKIVALSVSETDANHIRHILSVFDKANKETCIVDANVESARAASSGSRFSTLITAITGRADGVATTNPSDFQF